MDGLADGWTKELIDRWMEELTDGQLDILPSMVIKVISVIL